MAEKKTKKITLGLILSWILGIFFGLNAIVYLFTKQFIPTIAALAIFAVLLPPMNKLIKEKLNIELSRGIKITVVIIGIVIIMFTGDIDKINQQLGTSQQEIIPQEPQKQIVKSATLSIDRVQVQLANLYPSRLTVTNTGDVTISPKFDVYVYDSQNNEVCSGSPFVDEFSSISAGQEKTGEFIILGCTFVKDGTYTLRVDLLDSEYNRLDTKTKDFTVNYWGKTDELLDEALADTQKELEKISGEVVKNLEDLTNQVSEEENSGEVSKSEALNICYKRAKECSDDIIGIEMELKGACLDIYTWTPGTAELLDFAEGLC